MPVSFKTALLPLPHLLFTLYLPFKFSFSFKASSKAASIFSHLFSIPCEAKEKGSLELNYEYYNPIITYMEDGSDIDMLVNEFLDYIKRKSSRDVKNDLRNE